MKRQVWNWAGLVLVAVFVATGGCGGNGSNVSDECNECQAAGERTCEGAQFKVCADMDGDGCLEWGPLQDCPAGQACDAGACVTSGCTDECSPGDVSCATELTLLRCEGPDADGCYAWSAPINCKPGSTCVAGSGCPAECQNECETGERECVDGTSFRACAGDTDSDGCTEWGAAEACGEGDSCSDGVCGAACTNECDTAGRTACDGTTGTHVCGNFDEDTCLEWSDTQACAAGLVCERGQCQIPACDNECETGERECIVDSVRECGNFDEDTCLEWSAPEACPAGQSCSEGTCTTECTADCETEGDRECSGAAGYRVCGNYDSDDCLDWSSVFPCGGSLVCEEATGACVAGCENDCTSGDRECVGGDSYRICGNFDEDSCLEWGPETGCGDFYTCDVSDGSCDLACTQDCAAGAAQCAGEAQTQVCGVDFDEDPCREWGPAQDCPEGEVCSAETGQCSPPSCVNECEAGTRRCSADESGVQVCGNFDTDVCLEWSPTLLCNPGSTCIGEGRCAGACQDVCEEGRRICAGNASYLECTDSDEDGCLDWGAAVNCEAEERCEAGACISVCTSECDNDGDLGCSADGTAVVTCGNFDGDPCLEWGNRVACGETETCSNGTCATVCEDECTASQRQCSGEGYQTCGQFDEDTCLDWSNVTECPPGETCTGAGQCVVTCQDECEEGEGRCFTETEYQVCGNFDADECLEFSEETTPCEAETFCHEGACIPDTPPIVVLINEVLYDGPGDDQASVFLELVSDPDTSLDHVVLREVNGANGETTGTLSFSGHTVPADGYFVLAHNNASAELVGIADMRSVRANFQNDNESILLLWGGRVVLDALGYGFGADLTNFAGEQYSAPDVPAGESLTRDEASIDSDVNRWDFVASATPTPGAAFGTDWPKHLLGYPTDPSYVLHWSDLAADDTGLLTAALSDGYWEIAYALGDTAGNWTTETVFDEILYGPESEWILWYYAPPAVHPRGLDAVAFVPVVDLGDETTGSVYFGVEVGYAVPGVEGWDVEWIYQANVADVLGGTGMLVWDAMGADLTAEADGTPLVRYYGIDVATGTGTIHVARSNGDGTWDDLVAVDDTEILLAMDGFVTGTDDTTHLFYTVTLGDDGPYEIRHRSYAAGVWTAYDVVTTDLTSPSSGAATVLDDGTVTFCFVDTTRIDLDGEGNATGGASLVKCATPGEAGWGIETVLGETEGLLPYDLAVANDGATPVLAFTEFYEQSLWLLRYDAAWTLERIGWGGQAGWWPNIVKASDGTLNFLSSRVTPFLGLIHSHP